MTVNVRRRRRKIDPNYAKKKGIKKAGEAAIGGAIGGALGPGAGIAAKGLYGDWDVGEKPMKRQEAETGRRRERQKPARGMKPARGVNPAKPSKPARRMKKTKRASD